MQTSLDWQNRPRAQASRRQPERKRARAERVRDKVAADDGQLDEGTLPWMATWLVRGACAH